MTFQTRPQLALSLLLSAGLAAGCGSSSPQHVEHSGDAPQSRVVAAEPADEFETCRGEIVPADARAVLGAHAGAVRECYESALRAQPTLAGRLMLSVRVAPDGHVEAVRVGGTLDDEAVAACVREVALGMRFSAIDGDCGVVVVPFDLRPGSS